MQATCEKCGQTCIADGAWSIRGYCATCRHGGAERHETVRLFEPPPAPMAGQLELGGDDVE